MFSLKGYGRTIKITEEEYNCFLKTAASRREEVLKECLENLLEYYNTRELKEKLDEVFGEVEREALTEDI